MNIHRICVEFEFPSNLSTIHVKLNTRARPNKDQKINTLLCRRYWRDSPPTIISSSILAGFPANHHRIVDTGGIPRQPSSHRRYWRDSPPTIITSSILAGFPANHHHIVDTGGIPRQPSSHRPRTTTADSMNGSHVINTSTISLSHHSTTVERTSNEAHLVRPVIRRHINTSNEELVFGTYNARSIRNLEQADAVRQLRTEKAIDVLFLTETWHETADDVSLHRLRNDGLQVPECARPILPDCKKEYPNFINHGGIAIIGPNNIKISKLPFTAVTTFECLCVCITSLGSTCAVALIYRPDSQNVSQTFFKEFSKLLEYMSTLAVPMFITGDMNSPLIKPDHPNSVQFNDLLSSYCLLQHVTQPTHDGGGLLDIVLSRDDVPNLQVKVTDVGLSDHCLLTWAASIGRPNPVDNTTVRRQWKDVNAYLFRCRMPGCQTINS